MDSSGPVTEHTEAKDIPKAGNSSSSAMRDRTESESSDKWVMILIIIFNVLLGNVSYGL